MQSLANYRSMHMRMQQLAAEGALDGETDAAQRDRAAAGAGPGLLQPAAVIIAATCCSLPAGMSPSCAQLLTTSPPPPL
jgi:hypothetical protein